MMNLDALSLGPKVTTAELEPILNRVARGERDAVEHCLTEYGGLVWSLARRLSPTAVDAEDAVQEIFVELWKHAKRFDPAVAKEVTFVAMIARRRLIDRQRRRSNLPKTTEFDEANEPLSRENVQQQAEINDEAARAAACLTRLKPDERRVLELSVYEGQTHAEIAKSTGLPVGTVKTHARRGLIRLRELMQSRGVSAEASLAKGGGS